MAVIDKLGWIKRQKARFAAQPRQSRREMVTGESHYFLGRRYRLRVYEHQAPTRVALRGIATLELFVRPGTDAEQRETILLGWYREQIKSLILPLLEMWQAILGVQATAWGIRKMKTKWGSCNPISGRVWFNLELAKKPEQCLEYIVVHELLHLRIRRHDEEFAKQMESCLPNWKQAKDMLNHAPLGHEDWKC